MKIHIVLVVLFFFSLIISANSDSLRERNVFDATEMVETQTSLLPDLTLSSKQHIQTEEQLPDLVVSSLNSTSEAKPGELIQVGFIGENAGSAATGEYRTAFYLSSDAFIGSSDNLLGTYQYDSLNAGSSLYYFRLIRIPDDVVPGTYFLVIKANPSNEIDETDDANNVAYAQVTIAGTSLAESTPVPTQTPVPEEIIAEYEIKTTQADLSSSSADVPAIPPETPVPEEPTTPPLTRTTQTDLSISSVDIPDSSQPGELVQVGFVIQNSGSTASGSYKVSFYLSEDTTVDLSDISLAGSTYDSIGSGSSLYRMRFVPIPKDTPPGSYFLVVMADPQNGIAESDETNNAGNAQITLGESVPATISPAPSPAPTQTPVPTLPEETPLPEEITVIPVQTLPDLVVPSLDINDSVTAGELVQVGFSVTNPGSKSSGSYDTAFYLSSDPTIDLSGSILGRYPYESLGSGSSMYYLRFIRIPDDTSPGRYFFGVMADPQNTIDEGDETNNACFAEITIETTVLPEPAPTTPAPTQKSEILEQDLQPPEGKPDLSVVSVSAPESAEPGTEIPISISVMNVGTAISGPFKIAYLLSQDKAIDTSDVVLKTSGYDPVAPGDTRSETKTQFIPSFQSEGAYYLGIVIDSQNRFDELRDDNNAGFSNEPVEIRTIPEETLTPIPTSATPIPTQTPSGIVGLLPGIKQHPGPDLVVISVTAPNTASPETDLEVSYTIKNDGKGDSAPFKLGFTFSRDRIYDGTDSVLKTISVNPLAAGDSRVGSENLFIPSFQSLGEYYLGVIADIGNQNDESSERNNAGYTADPVTIRKEAGKEISQPTPGQSTGVISEKVAEILPDLAVVSVDIPRSVSSGTEIPVSFTLANRGEKNSGPFRIDITLSRDAVPDDSDTILHTFTNQPLKKKKTFTDSRNVFLLDTIPAGDYYVFVLLDVYKENNELLEDNNAGYAALSVQISIPHEEEILPTPSLQEEHGVISERIGVVQPDLRILSVTAPETAAPGTEIGVSFSAKNTGNQDARSFKVGFYLSQDTIITDSDFPLGSFGYDSLKVQGTLSDSKTLLIPSVTSEGEYYLGVIVDSYTQIEESSEDNNTGYAINRLLVQPVIEVVVEQTPASTPEVLLIEEPEDEPEVSEQEAHLVIHSVTIPPTAKPGDTISLSFILENDGEVDTMPLNLKVYLSKDTIITDRDLLINEYRYPAVKAGEFRRSNLNISLPPKFTPGEYYIGIIPSVGDPGVSKDLISISKPATVVVNMRTADYSSLPVTLFLDNIQEAKYTLSQEANPSITINPGLHTFRMEWIDTRCEEKTLSVEQKETFEPGEQKTVKLKAVKPELPDLRLQNLNYQYYFTVGGEIPIEFDLINEKYRASAEEGFPLYVYLSKTPSAISSSDQVYKKFYSDMSVNNIHEKMDIPIPMDIAPGTYYLIVEVDSGLEGGLICEEREDNNRAVSDPITISAPEEQKAEPEPEEEIEEPFDTAGLDLNDLPSMSISYEGLSSEKEWEYLNEKEKLANYMHTDASSWEEIARYKKYAAEEDFNDKRWADYWKDKLEMGDYAALAIQLYMAAKDVQKLKESYNEVRSISSLTQLADKPELMITAGEKVADLADTMSLYIDSQPKKYPETSYESAVLSGIAIGIRAYATSLASLKIDVPLYTYSAFSKPIQYDLDRMANHGNTQGIIESAQALIAEKLHTIASKPDLKQADIEEYFNLALNFSNLEKTRYILGQAYSGDDKSDFIKDIETNIENIESMKRFLFT